MNGLLVDTIGMAADHGVLAALSDKNREVAGHRGHFARGYAGFHDRDRVLADLWPGADGLAADHLQRGHPGADVGDPRAEAAARVTPTTGRTAIAVSSSGAVLLKARRPAPLEDMPVNEESVKIPSAGLNLSGVVGVPDGIGRQERRAAFLVLHGFGSNKESGNALAPTKVLGELGYVTLRF